MAGEDHLLLASRLLEALRQEGGEEEAENAQADLAIPNQQQPRRVADSDNGQLRLTSYCGRRAALRVKG